MDSSGAPEKRTYRKHFVPLESNPEVFTELVHKLGVSEAYGFQDVLSLDDLDLLAFIPRPALALVLVFPSFGDYEKRRQDEIAKEQQYDGFGENEVVFFWKQTIHNACGLYALLHAISNGEARSLIGDGSIMSGLLEAATPCKPEERALVLEGSVELEKVYASVAQKGDTAAPDADSDVDYHYICFVKSSKTGHLFQLDGDRGKPIDLGPLKAEEDVLSDKSLSVIRSMVEDAEAGNIGFSLMALTLA